MRRLRRLESTPADTYRKAQRGALRYVSLDVERFRALERAGRVIIDGESVLAAEAQAGRIELHYAFASHEAFVRQFPAMFARLLPSLREEQAQWGIRLRLTERSGRPYIEPVLRAHAFEVVRDWIGMTLHDLSAYTPLPDEVAPGFVVRTATVDDAEAIARLDEISFPTPYLTPAAARRTLEGAREALTNAQVFRMLEDKATGRAAGLIQLEARPGVTGNVTTVAVDPEYRRRGLGEAMVRWALGWFQSQGLRRATLTVSADNGPAIALYRKLGFVASELGLDYYRPLDEEEARQVLERNRASHITVRRRYR
jgi:ribosomal protein S18 acetylase RimI-like enzyme